MKARVIALAMLLASVTASCTENHDTTILVDNDLCMLTRDELIQFFADVVGIVFNQLGPMPLPEEKLVLKLVEGALETCGHEPLDGGG